MHYRDLEPYRYTLLVGLKDVVTIGWLSASGEFPVGEIEPELREALTALLVGSRVNKTRGYHLCEFCGSAEPATVELPSGPLRLGSAEIWVPSADGTRIFAAPDLVYHYMFDHQYAPPSEFLMAVKAARSANGWNASKEWEKRVQEVFARRK